MCRSRHNMSLFRQLHRHPVKRGRDRWRPERFDCSLSYLSLEYGDDLAAFVWGKGNPQSAADVQNGVDDAP